MADAVQESSADKDVATEEGSQPHGEEGDVTGPWAVPTNTSITGCLKETTGRRDLWGAVWEREKASFPWKNIAYMLPLCCAFVGRPERQADCAASGAVPGKWIQPFKEPECFATVVC